MQDNTHPPILTVNTERFPEVSPEMTSSSPVSGQKLQRKKSFGQRILESPAMPQNWGRKSVSEPPSPDPSSPNVPQSVFASHDVQNSLNAPVSTRKATAKTRKSISKTSSEPATPASTGSTSFTMPKSSLASPGAVDKADKHVNIVDPPSEEQATAEISEPSVAPDQKPDVDAAPTSPAPDQQSADQAPIVPKETLRSAFDYTFSTSANIETAQQMFRDACADHVYPVNFYSRQEFISLLKEKLWYRRRFASKEFFQVFMNIAAFVHQYVDPGLDQDIAATFAQAQKGPKWIFASRLNPRMHCEFNQRHAHPLPLPSGKPLPTHDFPEPGTYVELDCMHKSAEYNARLIEAAGDRVDPRKKTLDYDTRFTWKNIMLKRLRAPCLP